MNWLSLNSGNCNAAFNMALDEALLENASQIGKPVLRFYGWTEPAASFGYFQKYAGVERATHLRPLVRRPTGGGIVPHDRDWTYSFVVPPNHEWHLLKAEESYRRVHEWIQRAFARLAVETELASRSRREEAQAANLGKSHRLLTSSPTNQCFVGHVKFDLLWNGRKIAGAAQRRNKLGLLFQGSVQPPVPLDRLAWQQAMRDIAHTAFGVEWLDFEPDKPLRERAETLVRQKYSQREFITKR